MNPVSGPVTLEEGDNVIQLPFTPSYIETRIFGKSTTDTTGAYNGEGGGYDGYQWAGATYAKSSTGRGKVLLGTKIALCISSTGASLVEGELTDIDDVNDRITINCSEADANIPTILKLWP